MAFLIDDDYKAQIKDGILATIIENTAGIRTDAERKAQAQITSALAVRYDVPNIFNRVGDDRNFEVVMYMVDMVIYHIHARINPGQVPALRNDRYVDAKEWLKMVAGGKLLPDLPMPAGETDLELKKDVQYGGRCPRDPYY